MFCLDERRREQGLVDTPAPMVEGKPVEADGMLDYE
jgi:hypothetical protein